MRDLPPEQFAARKSGERRPWRTALKVLVSALLLVWIVTNADLAAVRDTLVGVDPRWLAFAFALYFIGAALIALRFGGLLAVKGVTPGLRYLFVSTLVSAFFRQFLPSILGGDAIRGYDAWRAGAEPGFAVIALVMDRLLGLVALAVFALLAIALIDDLHEAFFGLSIWILLGLAAIGGTIALLGGWKSDLTGRLSSKLPGKLVAKASTFTTAIASFDNQRAVLARGLAISFVLQVNVVTFYWALSRALGFDLDYAVFFAIVPIAVFVMMLPISINGIGLREAAFIGLLALWNVDESRALSFAWLEYGSVLAFGLVGGVIYALRRR